MVGAVIILIIELSNYVYQRHIGGRSDKSHDQLCIQKVLRFIIVHSFKLYIWLLNSIINVLTYLKEKSARVVEFFSRSKADEAIQGKIPEPYVYKSCYPDLDWP